MIIFLLVLIGILILKFIVAYIAYKKKLTSVGVIKKIFFKYRIILIRMYIRTFNIFINEEELTQKVNICLLKRNNFGISKSPYQLLKTTDNSKPHFPTILNLTAVDLFGETVHPDVIYLENGFGSSKWKYLMSITRYPAGNDIYENPEFLVSNDGINWELPTGAASPIIPSPSDWIGYNSDTSLLCDNNKIYLFYRKSQFIRDKSVDIVIYRLTTENGINWSKPTKLLSSIGHENCTAKLMSPTIVKLNGKYIMWYVDNNFREYNVYKRESYDCLTWSDSSIVELSSIKYIHPWHIDVIVKEGILHMALSVLNIVTKQYSIYKCTSIDNGSTWSELMPLITPYYAFEEKGCYRGSLVFVGNDLYIYYTGIDRNYTYSTAVTKV